jgi:hypothetical protein
MYTNPGPYTHPGPCVCAQRRSAASARKPRHRTHGHPGHSAQRAPSSSCAPGCRQPRHSRRDTHLQRPGRSDRTAVELGRPWIEDQRAQQRPAVARGLARLLALRRGGHWRRPRCQLRLHAVAPARKKMTPDLRKGRERDPVSRDTQKARAARPRTSPSKDVGCCSCAQLAVPEQQRSCQHAPSTHSKKRSERQSVGRATRSTGE